MSQPNLQCMGIDVAKLSLDIATTDTIEPFTVGNDEDGFNQLYGFVMSDSAHARDACMRA